MASKPFIFPIRTGRFDTFSPTSETALHWVMPGVVLLVAGLMMAGTLSRPALAWSVRRLRPTWRGMLVIFLGLGAGFAMRQAATTQTLYERLATAAAMLDQLEARLLAASALTSATPLPASARAAVQAVPGAVDLLLRSELTGQPAPDAHYVHAGVLTPLLAMRRAMRIPSDAMYFAHLHEPIRAEGLRMFTRAEALRYIVIVDLTPGSPELMPSGTHFTATGTVVDLEVPEALGVVTSLPDTSPYLATRGLLRRLGLPER